MQNYGICFHYFSSNYHLMKRWRAYHGRIVFKTYAAIRLLFFTARGVWLHLWHEKIGKPLSPYQFVVFVWWSRVAIGKESCMMWVKMKEDIYKYLLLCYEVGNFSSTFDGKVHQACMLTLMHFSLKMEYDWHCKPLRPLRFHVWYKKFKAQHERKQNQITTSRSW